MIVKLPLGKDNCPVDLRGIRVRPIECTAPAGAVDPADLVARALDQPIEGPSLVEICGGLSAATVVVPDGTREAYLGLILPEIFSRLRRGGVAESETTVLVACGTHPSADEDTLLGLMGELPGAVKVVQHDAQDPDGLITVGAVGGLPIQVNRRVVGERVLITVSVVKHHYFAGFGGGPKMIFPGVAGYSEIQANHKRVLVTEDGGRHRHPCCEPGVLDNNPVAEEIARAADLYPPDLAVCMVPGKGGGIADAMAGPWRATFEAAVARVRGWFEVTVPQPFTLAVASAGGAPFDATLIQAHKGLDVACRYVADGGEILFVADLSGGAGSPDMEPFLERPEPESIFRRLEAGWVQYGHTTLRLVEKTSRCKVHLVSRLEPNLARRLGFHPVDDPGEVIDSWRHSRAGETAAVLTGAPVYPSLP